MSKSIYVNYELLGEYNYYSGVDPVVQLDRFDWMRRERGIDLSLIDEENALEEYISDNKERLEYINKRKEMLHIWSNGASELKKAALRKEYRALLEEEKEILYPVAEMEREIDSSFSENADEEVFLNPDVGRQMTDFFKLNVDRMSLEELNICVDGLLFMFEDKTIYYGTWVELTLVCYSRAIKLTNPQCYMRNGIRYIKKYDAGYDAEYKKFLKMYASLNSAKRDREAAPTFYEMRERGYLTENEIVAAIDASRRGTSYEIKFSVEDELEYNEFTNVLDALEIENWDKEGAAELMGVSVEKVGEKLEEAVSAYRDCSNVA
jgi:hypothetical protein